MSLAIPIPHLRTRHESAPHAPQAPIKRLSVLDPDFVKTVKTVTPLDPGVGTVASEAMTTYGPREFVDRGERPEVAKQHAQRVARVLSTVGNYAVRIPEDEYSTLEAIAPRGVEAQVTLNAMHTLATRHPDSYLGSQAASFIDKVDQSNTHVLLG